MVTIQGKGVLHGCKLYYILNCTFRTHSDEWTEFEISSPLGSNDVYITSHLDWYGRKAGQGIFYSKFTDSQLKGLVKATHAAKSGDQAQFLVLLDRLRDLATDDTLVSDLMEGTNYDMDQCCIKQTEDQQSEAENEVLHTQTYWWDHFPTLMEAISYNYDPEYVAQGITELEEAIRNNPDLHIN